MDIPLPEERELRLLRPALDAHRIDARTLEPLRIAASSVWRLRDTGLVWKVAPASCRARAHTSLRAAQWLTDTGIPAVRAPFAEPVWEDDQIVVTAWEDYGEHREAAAREMARALAHLHAQKPPYWLPTYGALDLTYDGIEDVTWVASHDLRAVKSLLDSERRYAEYGFEKDEYVALHGDAWPGNFPVTAEGEVLMGDLERFTRGPRSYDLATIAVKATVIGQYPPALHQRSATAYGLDVTALPQWPHLRMHEILRACCYALRVAEHNTAARRDAAFRLECLLGRHGAGPWVWRPLPVAPGAAYET